MTNNIDAGKVNKELIEYCDDFSCPYFSSAFFAIFFSFWGGVIIRFGSSPLDRAYIMLPIVIFIIVIATYASFNRTLNERQIENLLKLLKTNSEKEIVRKIFMRNSGRFKIWNLSILTKHLKDVATSAHKEYACSVVGDWKN